MEGHRHATGFGFPPDIGRHAVAGLERILIVVDTVRDPPRRQMAARGHTWTDDAVVGAAGEFPGTIGLSDGQLANEPGREVFR